MKDTKEVQWINLHRNKSLVKIRLTLLCEKFEATLLVLVGFMAGQQGGRQADGQIKC